MKKNLFYILWGTLYILCAVLGLFNDPTPSQTVAMTVISVLFFLPALILLIDALRKQDRKTLLLLRWLSALSLSLTLVVFIANIISVSAPQVVGTILHYVLLFISVPMFCSHYWVLSLFLWACLLFATFSDRKNKA